MQVSDSKSLLSVLDKAFENANYQLKIARNDQTTAQALKMTDENEVLDADDDLDILRWYVYPRECALFLKKGADAFPDTLSNKISGAIRPSGFFEAANYKFKSPLPVGKEIEQIPSALISDANAEEGDIECNAEVAFRDGEHHSGEAHIDDIIAGHEDGELSDNCLIYVEKEGDWIPIGQFLKRRKTPVSANKSNEPESMKIDEIMPTSTPPAAVSEVSAIPKPAEKDASRDKKKPSRDSAAWGKTAVTKMPLPNTNSAVPSGEQEVKAAVENKGSHPEPQLNNVSNKQKKHKHIKPPAKLMRYITQAVMQWDMIEEGDRLLLGLSGGKDSLTLLHCLLEYRRKAPTKFEIEVCTIDPMTPSFDPSPLIPYVESLGLKYHYIRDNIIDRANTAGTDGQIVKSLCSFCARMKRGNLYSTARKNNCNKLVLAQHLDDCAESFLMSAMHNGFIRSKSPRSLTLSL